MCITALDTSLLGNLKSTRRNCYHIYIHMAQVQLQLDLYLSGISARSQVTANSTCDSLHLWSCSGVVKRGSE